MAAKLKTPKRRENSFFGLHFDLHPNEKDTELGRLVTPAMVQKIIRAARPDFIQYDSKGHDGHLGYKDSKINAGGGGGTGKGIVNDSLTIYRRVTKEAGVALYVHFSGVCDALAIKDHPEWAAIKSDGTKEGMATSNFGPYVRERMVPQMKEIIDRYRVDGFWVDGDCWGAAVDYCAAAIAKFKEITGRDEPPKKVGEPLWYEWVTIHRDQFFVYAKTYMDAVHSYAQAGGHPVQIASNWLYSPLAPEPVKMPVDFISGDYSHSDSVNSARVNGRYMSNVGLPWDLMAWAFSITSAGSHLYKPAEQIMQEAAAILPLGGGFQIYFHPDRHGGFPDWQIGTMREVADFCHARKDVCFQSQGVPQVALLLDTTTLFTISPMPYSPWFGEYNAMQGTLHAILEAGHCVDVLADHHLPWQQDHWPVIVVPEWKFLPVGVADELVQYAHRGGSLFIIGAEACGIFKEHLGVEFVGEPADVERSLQWPAARGAVPMKGMWQDVTIKRKGAAKVLAMRSDDRAGDVHPMPAATLTKVGKGQIAAFYGPLGTNHHQQHAPAARDFVEAVLAKLYQPRVTIDTRHIDLAVREKDGKLIVHLTNVRAMPTATTGYQMVDRIPPSDPVTVRVRVRGRPKRVTLEPGGKRLPIKWTRGVLTVTVPPVHIHSAVVIQ